MRHGRKTLLILLGASAALLASLYVYQAFFVAHHDLIPSVIGKWDFLQTIVRALAWVPALTAASILIAFGIAPKEEETAPAGRRYLSTLRGPIVVITLAAIAYAVFIAWALPAARGDSARLVSASATFSEELSSAEASLKVQDWSGAALHLSVAGAIAPDDKRYVLQKGIYDKRPGAASEQEGGQAPSVIDAKAGQSATVYFEEAKAAYQSGDFYRAHSLATLSYRIDPRREEAQRLAAQAWNQIAVQGDSKADIEQRSIAKDKEAAYQTLQAGDYISAYDQFLDLKKRAAKDPDIETFLDQSLQGVRQISFFRDEVDKLSLYPSSENVFFRASSKGGQETFYAARKVYLGAEIAYFSDFEEMVLQDGAPVLHVTSPYAKLRGGKILLASYERNDPQKGYFADFQLGGDKTRIQTYLDSPLETKGLALAIASTRDPSSLDLLSLLACGRGASAYGIDPAPFVKETYSRVGTVLGYFALCVFALFLGYRFRHAGEKVPVAELILVAPLSWILSHLLFQTWLWLDGLWLDLSMTRVPALSTLVFLLIQAAAIVLAFALLAGYRDRPSD